MKHCKLLRLLLCMLVCMSAMGQGAQAQTEEADYLLLMDVSGGRNIYMEDVQHAIDTFYVEAIRHDRVRAYSFAKTVTEFGSNVDADYYAYCDLGGMLRRLSGLMSECGGRYIRVLILSDFHNATPADGMAPLQPSGMTDVSRSIATLCQDRDVEVHLLVLPPSTRYEGYSLQQVQQVLGTERCMVELVEGGKQTARYMLDIVHTLNRQRGISDDGPAKGSMPLTVISLTIMAAAIVVLYKWGQKVTDFIDKHIV